MKKVVLFPLLTCVVVALCVSYLIPLLLLSETNKGIILMLFASDCLSAALLVTLAWLVTCSTTKSQGGSTRSQSVTTRTQIVGTHGSQMENTEISNINLGGKHNV